MGLIDTKVTQQEIDDINVKSVPGSKLRGTVQENKNVFDKLPEFVANRINAVIDAVISSGSSEILIRDKDGNLVTLGEVISNPDDMMVIDNSVEPPVTVTIQDFINTLNQRIVDIVETAGLVRRDYN